MRMLKLCVVLGLAVAAQVASAQGFPSKPIRMVVAFPPGGSTDLAARALGEKLAAVFGQPVIVDNKPGASGNIGAEFVAKSAPDGHTLLMAATSFATAPAFFPKLGWDPVKDFAPVSMVATVPIIVVVHPSVQANNARELIAYSKANPGKLNLASPGAATLTRLSGEMFKQAAGVDWVTVHYKGGPPAVADLLGGQSQVMFANISDVISQVKAGRLRAIAVTTAKRSAVAPELPTLAESGLPGFDASTWQAIFAPAGTPREVVQRLNSEIGKAMAVQEMKDKFLVFGTDAATGTPEELGRFLASEVTKITKIAR
ncbi:MAG: tripartite tricarboxylate transporter substrate binding protein, partial [Betaproteobacteria bacterium]|nr:tripartite tricarboxylate transporter substrate binding protein [Betaproteobacteria bacterium]